MLTACDYVNQIVLVDNYLDLAEELKCPTRSVHLASAQDTSGSLSIYNFNCQLYSV